MRRRRLVALFGAATELPGAPSAQPAALPVIGILNGAPPVAFEHLVAAFQHREPLVGSAWGLSTTKRSDRQLCGDEFGFMSVADGSASADHPINLDRPKLSSELPGSHLFATAQQPAFKLPLRSAR